MVKVTQFALTEGKIAVHCHAGLGERSSLDSFDAVNEFGLVYHVQQFGFAVAGRTGVLISAYLVYANRMNPHEAIHYMRSKRFVRF